MRKFFLGAGMVLGIYVMGWAQEGTSSPGYLGTKTPYVFSGGAATPPPAGFRPVFISYAGRHGARFLTKEGTDLQVLRVLQSAEKSDGLTEMGLRVAKIVRHLLRVGKGNYERITLLGELEQAAIGERMHQHYGSVFTGRGLEVVTTWKLRTQQSAAAFLKGLGKYEGALKWERAPDSADTALRFYDLSPAYQRYKKSSGVKRSLDSLDKDERTAATAKRVCARLFRPAFARLMEGGGIAFVDDLYDLYSIGWSMSGELKAAGDPGDREGLGAAFDKDGLEWLDFRNGAADFLEKGPGFDSVGIQVKVAAPLLADIINSLDRAVGKADAPDAVLRFTHAEAIAPLAALSGIRGASSSARSIYLYHDHWRAEDVIPLSANIQWILYAGDGGTYLVKVLLNEREAALPVATRQWPYYQWEDLRAYYVGKLGELGVGLRENMQEYLRGLE
ncbi:histidine-type phosphatase [Flavitalea sp. BT771]|nr:histidine-type phosphatase [Flavitalea sp. BT771]MDO6434955.1 histidine-type phosphatase [Flavitalea sp. BT771]MDV6223855.1 histidine-type phosphatase [Flavitalea sp. BT771]